MNPIENTDAAPPPQCLTVLYDGACPLCRREIGVYRDLVPMQPVDYVDVTDPSSNMAAQLPEGLTREQLLARFHVRLGDGRIESGAQAFIELWSRLPYWRWLARLARLPGVTPLLELAYRGFLRIRPAMQRIAGRF
jgi:predicted DCC family thiol-disulfide oxidoreductase YuxK